MSWASSRSLSGRTSPRSTARRTICAPASRRELMKRSVSTAGRSGERRASVTSDWITLRTNRDDDKPLGQPGGASRGRLVARRSPGWARLTAAEVAEREGSAPTTTFRLMRACVAIGLLTADANGRFGSTPLLQTLRKDTRGSLRDLALAMTQPSQWLPLNEFVTSVRTGQSQVSAALGMDFFDYLEQHPSQAREFSAGVGSTTALWAADAAK